MPEKEKIGSGKIVRFADAKRETESSRKETTVTNRSDEEKKLLDEVLPNVAAQMRAPLSVMYACMRKLVASDAPGSDLMNRSYYQLLRLAANLSAAEWLENGIYGADLRNGDIAAFCAGLSERIAPLAAEKGIEWSYVCAKKSHTIVFDRRLMERLVLNLVSNALKFTPAGGRVTLSLQVKGRDVLLSVADTGCGIAKDKMETLFDRYLHSDRMDPTPHGLGLGLPLCRAIAQLHGGRIVAQSRVGAGTKITVTLPNEQSVIQHLESACEFDYAGGYDHVLIELSDALGVSAYPWKGRTK